MLLYHILAVAMHGKIQKHYAKKNKFKTSAPT